MMEKVVVAPKTGSVAANVGAGPVMPSINAILNMIVKTFLIFFIDFLFENVNNSLINDPSYILY